MLVLALAASARPPPPPRRRPTSRRRARSSSRPRRRTSRTTRRPTAAAQIASATKLMTALLTLERSRPSAVFRAVRYRALPVESKINLRPGERMTVADLLRGLLIESANDAAVTLAERVARLARRTSCKAMNVRAQQLGLRDTHYANPIGLDAPGNYSSARDLVRLTLRLRAFEFFRRTVARESGDAAIGRPPAHAREPQPARAAAADQRRQDGPHAAGGLRADRLRPQARDHADLGRPRGAERGRARVRHAAAARVVVHALPARPCRRTGRGARACARSATAAGRSSTSWRATARAASSCARARRCGAAGSTRPPRSTGPIRRGQALGKLRICRGKKKIATLPVVASADVPKAGAAVRTKDWFTRPLTLLLVVLLGLGGSVLLARARRRGPNGRRRSRADSEPEAA